MAHSDLQYMGELASSEAVFGIHRTAYYVSIISLIFIDSSFILKGF